MNIYTILNNDRLELKNVKVYEELTEETTACYAEVWLNDEYIGIVRNSGQGEANSIRYKDRGGKDRMTRFEKSLSGLTWHVKPYLFVPDGMDVPLDLDLLIGLMAEAAHYEHKTFFKI